MNDSISVLLVEDDQRLAQFTADYLTTHHMSVTHVSDGEAALSAMGRDNFDALLLDVVLPKRDGISVCQRIRANSDVPVIMITARVEEADRVLGLESGADDYVVKPFSPRELLARLHAVVRRARGQLARGTSVARVGSLSLHEATRTVTLHGETVALTTAEFDILLELARRPGFVFSRDRLLTLLHGPEDGTFDRAIDVLISRLRRKLALHSDGAQLIETVRGVGYVLRDPSC